MERWFGETRFIRKERVGVQLIVAEEFEQRTVKLVCAGLCRDVEHAAGCPSVFGREGASGGFEFLNRLHADGVDQRTSADAVARGVAGSATDLRTGRLVARRATVLAESHIDAVHEKVVSKSRRAVELDSAAQAIERVRRSVYARL